MKARDESPLEQLSAQIKAGPGNKVLIVEDDDIVTQVVSDILAALGFSIITSANGSEALELFESESEQIALIILDYGIPGLHPSRLLERFKEVNPSVKVIVSSGYSRNAVSQDFPIETIDGFIGKPYDPESLITQVTKIVTRSGKEKR